VSTATKAKCLGWDTYHIVELKCVAGRAANAVRSACVSNAATRSYSSKLVFGYAAEFECLRAFEERGETKCSALPRRKRRWVGRLMAFGDQISLIYSVMAGRWPLLRGVNPIVESGRSHFGARSLERWCWC
jgi:hypothetical protein